jgi:ribosomal protein L37AE/L43A
MNWLDKAERRFARFAIRNLMRYIVFMMALVYVLTFIGGGNIFLSKLVLRPDLVMKGEVWRLITYIFIPPSTGSPLFVIIALYFYNMIGTTLEHEWGSFRFNMYYLIGMVGTTIAAIITGAGTSTYLNLSLFLAFAKLYPEHQILVFFILPVKMKYLGWLSWAGILFSILTAPMPMKFAAIVSILNYLVFFGRDIILGRKNARNAYINRRRFNEKMPKISSMHKCTVCGVTEVDDPKMEFRYCSRCEGHYEYCMEHLQDHEHIVKKVEE